MKRVLVTGGSGFIGRHTLSALGDRGFDVHAVSSQTRSSSTIRWHQADLQRAPDVARVIDSVRPSHLLHLAWFAVPGAFWTSPENLRWVQASIELVRAFAAAGGQRLVAAGTCAEYDISDSDCDERETALRPSTLYGTCKHASRLILEGFAEGRFSMAWGRVFHLYGPHEHPDRLVPSVIRSLMEERPALCTAGVQVRDFLHVADVADAFAALLDSAVCGPVNVASGSPVSVADVVSEIGRQMHAGELVRLGARPTPPHDPLRLTARVARLRDEVGWSPAFDLARGLRATIDWWRSGDGSLSGPD
ncbi:MAG TPA: NAD(P)-dependent oxidoreductase [Vicinamibacterales bacterium]|nr:NAD(P)-dependent oxidoreductase [Vicinamibacterales bacterium]